ncbi:hypothetical protein MCOR25_010870 [Pyricularia grisea]|uniref:Uncharacterized protein n=1 Tax=Pyricularia grisea TaxID=148305 RepID=A0A6P8AM98_PYRGI|nr:uncharacterized protein PgNI_12549 [Pyricularia grisea]KAI6347931.1 hypothetical protein MCOR25_010870 [Pyricularia grisea]TLD03158.1 hypothetical protein PgNI_12549 [Pyricularia grisea]
MGVPDDSSSFNKLIHGSTLEEFQTTEQRILLDTISHVRKCGLDSILSLPQIVVCGDQSAGKSSVLEALTEIPFPRNDNLCTRFATEISLRREPVGKITVKIVPDSSRPEHEKQNIKTFSQSITTFADLPIVIDAAMTVMGISGSDDASSTSAFAKDTLSIDIDGPNRPQLTLVDIPGLIQTSTKGVSDNDVEIVKEITDYYISQPRTICLAVVSATNDAANQGILQQVRKFDPLGERTLGVITKPDKLEAGSGSEKKFLELARNEDVFFQLGWHVIKNRKFEERSFSFEERNTSETNFFRSSSFRTLPQETCGIDTLRTRLSHLLYGHVKNELPRLMGDLEVALESSESELEPLGDSRSTALDCRTYLTHLSMDCHEICKAALNGHYEHEFFRSGGENAFSLKNKSTIARLRAAIQYCNSQFSEDIWTRGHKYQIPAVVHADLVSDSSVECEISTQAKIATPGPKRLSKTKATEWVKRLIQRSRGTELFGSFNPNVIAELFWEQSQPWAKFAESHIDLVSYICEQFYDVLLKKRGAKDVASRIWSFKVRQRLEERKAKAREELRMLIEDLKGFPINYNHYYTDNLHRTGEDKLRTRLNAINPALLEHRSSMNCSRGAHYDKFDLELVIGTLSKATSESSVDMEKFSCEEALDCLHAIYKVQLKVFVANVTNQVIERHMLRDLEHVFSPLVVATMNDTEVKSVALESSAIHHQRKFLLDRISKLEESRVIFRNAVGML